MRTAGKPKDYMQGTTRTKSYGPMTSIHIYKPVNMWLFSVIPGPENSYIVPYAQTKLNDDPHHSFVLPVDISFGSERVCLIISYFFSLLLKLQVHLLIFIMCVP